MLLLSYYYYCLFVSHDSTQHILFAFELWLSSVFPNLAFVFDLYPQENTPVMLSSNPLYMNFTFQSIDDQCVTLHCRYHIPLNIKI